MFASVILFNNLKLSHSMHKIVVAITGASGSIIRPLID